MAKIKNSKKKGLFLSIETIGVIIIITAIAAVVVAGIAHLFKMYKVYQVSRDVAQYSEAVSQFKMTYGYLPGDLPLSKLNGPLANTFLMTDMGTCNGGLSLGYINRSAGITIAFRELYISKLISSAINTTASVPGITSGCSSTYSLTALVTDLYAPVASWDSNLAWVLSSEVPAVTYDGVIGTTVLAPYWGFNRPRLTLVRHSGSTGTGPVPSIGSQLLGALSPTIAYYVDIKLDDGIPSDVGSNVIGQGVSGALSKCTSIASTITTIANTTLVNTLKYQSSSDDSGSNGCIMTFGINAE